jgi:hypothetical protein|tara:strand:- start:300 stop:542 length:243 start_codon:yes stop_codon:yes gene_type:complete
MIKLKDMILKERINMGSAGFKRYFEVVERHFDSLDGSFKRLIKDLDEEGYKKESSELKGIHKKHFTSFLKIFLSFKRKNT